MNGRSITRVGSRPSWMVVVCAVALLAAIACGDDGGETQAPPGTSSLLPTAPTAGPQTGGDRPPTIQLNTPGPTATPLPTYTPAPTYTPVPLPTSTPYPTATPYPAATPEGTATPTPSPTPTPVATPPSEQSGQPVDSLMSRASFETSGPPDYIGVAVTDRGTVWGTPERFTADSSLGAVAYMLLGRLMGCGFADGESDHSGIVYVKLEELGRLSEYQPEQICRTTSNAWDTGWGGLRIARLRFFDESGATAVREYAYDPGGGHYVASPAVSGPARPTATGTTFPMPVPSKFTSVSAGYDHSCGLKTDGTINCWGDGVSDDHAPPSGSFASVSAGHNHTCGVRTDGRLLCWGAGRVGGPTPHAGQFTAVSAGEDYDCGVASDGAVLCWGADGYGQATPPDGRFTSVSAGEEHTCGVTVEGAVRCWGRNRDGRATPPGGNFASVSVGREHTCGVTVDGALLCWGEDRYGKVTPPGARFASVSAGGRNHSCGVAADGGVLCWGDDGYGQATPPEGRFASVSAGSQHTCGVTVDGTVLCWGSNESGQAAPNPICQAVASGDVHAVRQIIAAGTDVNARDCGEDPLLHTAVSERDPEMVRLLVEAGADVNARTSRGHPLLYRTVSWGEPGIVGILVNAGADVNASNSWGDPLLHTAVEEGDTDVVRTLLNAGADVNARDGEGTSPTRLAFEEEEFEILRLLLAAGAEVDFPPPAVRIRVVDRSDSSLAIAVAGSRGLETHYALRRRGATASGQWVDLEVRDTDGRFEDRGLAAQSTYHYTLQACNAAGCSESSPATGGVTEASGRANPPAAPSLDGERVPDRTTASLSWNNIAGATYYRVYQDDGLDAEVSAPQTAHIDLSPNSSFSLFWGWSFDKTVYRVKACNKAGCSPFSNKITLP